MATWECILSDEAEKKLWELTGRDNIPIHVTVDAPEDTDRADIRRQAFEDLLAKLKYWGGDPEREDLMALADERHMLCSLRRG